ncbi:hypothetical protein NDU88_003612 [Pleurodeles waltl]|uniref:Uncharacterized protein n=1 Tax=Pleurodeles waltl TaxID=8319 RepID=A0AAV7RIQ4_PLEWA|nr:hypothetical protein NDU88_003612 [Pleurodeles waltl]
MDCLDVTRGTMRPPELLLQPSSAALCSTHGQKVIGSEWDPAITTASTTLQVHSHPAPDWDGCLMNSKERGLDVQHGIPSSAVESHLLMADAGSAAVTPYMYFRCSEHRCCRRVICTSCDGRPSDSFCMK